MVGGPQRRPPAAEDRAPDGYRAGRRHSRLFLEEITLRDAAGRRLLRVQPAEPVAENPVFTLGGLGHGPVEASGRDNNGNQFSTRIAP